jgi:hypothetical protein
MIPESFFVSEMFGKLLDRALKKLLGQLAKI